MSDVPQILYRFEYGRLMSGDNDPYLLTAVLDRDWKMLVRSKFLEGRVSEQTLADGEVYRYEYQLKGAEVTRTTVTLPSGDKREFFFRDGILTDQK